LEKKEQVRKGKKTKKGVTWADESKMPARNEEGHSGCSCKTKKSCNVKVGDNDEGQDEQQKSENQRDESSLTLKESKAKNDNTAADRDRDSAQISVLEDGTQRPETNNDSKTLLTNDITKKNDDQDELTEEKLQSPEKSDKDASSGASREETLTDMTGDDETAESNTAAEFKMEKTSVKEPTGASSVKPEKHSKKVKCKKKKK